jgi:hypothetical protein
MYKVVVVFLASFLVAGATAQEAETQAGEEPTAGATAEAPVRSDDEVPEAASGEEEEDEADVDDADLDEQTYEEDEDDFIPTEEIPADEPIAFPSNI